MGLRRLVTLSRADSVIHVEMTQRYYNLFTYLNERLGQQVDTADITKDLDITPNNLRVTVNSLRKQVEGYYTIINKWGKYYQMDKL